jgi:urease accessory protein
LEEAMSWHARLALQFHSAGDRCIAHSSHEGPLRVLKSLYPEGEAICHQVLVHPPGGIVGGDRLDVELSLAPHSHAVIGTPGATRFYRSEGLVATQQVQADLASGARLEWLPQETIAHSGCIAENIFGFTLASGAEMLGWDLLALGLPTAGERFTAGQYLQQLVWPAVWLERGLIAGPDKRLLDSALGLAGRSAMLTQWFASGNALAGVRAQAMQAAARDAVDASAPAEGLAAGVTAPNEQMIVLRALAHRIEPLMALAQRVRALWRRAAWQLDAPPLRLWRT